MKILDILPVCLLIIVVTAPALFLSLKMMSLMGEDREFSRKKMQEWEATSTSRVQTMLNLMLSSNLPMFMGLQSQTSQNATSSKTSGYEEYISRDDVNEHRRLTQMNGVQAQAYADVNGLGEAIFDDDPEAREALADLFGQGMINYDGEVQ